MHSPFKPLTIRYLRLLVAVILAAGTLPLVHSAGTEEPEYQQFYNPDKGFKPAQVNLTEIFLQLAGSLEHHGSPEPYLRHMQAEHKRVSALFEKKMGKPHQSRMPSYMTDAYVDRTIANWNSLSPKIGLDKFAREAGRCAREGIRGTRTTGTIAIDVFNEHQKTVVAAMKTGSMKGADFESLRARLIKELEFDKTQIDTLGYPVTRRDAVSYALIFRRVREQLYKKLDSALPSEKSGHVKDAVDGAFLDLGRLAQSELEIGILELFLNK